MKNNIPAFRNILAENGIEVTLEEAEQIYGMARDILKKSKKMSMDDIWSIIDMEVEGMSQIEKEQVAEIYRTAREL